MHSLIVKIKGLLIKYVKYETLSIYVVDCPRERERERETDRQTDRQ